MDISLLLVDYSQASPEAARDNGGKEILFPKENRFSKSTHDTKISSSDSHSWVKAEPQLHTDCPSLNVDRFHLPTDQKPIQPVPVQTCPVT